MLNTVTGMHGPVIESEPPVISQDGLAKVTELGLGSAKYDAESAVEISPVQSATFVQRANNILVDCCAINFESGIDHTLLPRGAVENGPPPVRKLNKLRNGAL